MTLLLRFATHSEIGLVRKNNQDSGYASPHLLLVADGMGGAAAGDLASAVAVEVIREVDGPTAAEQMLPVLAAAIAAANDRIAELVEQDGSLDGMGTTVTGALFDGHELGLAHIGDSRAYLLREGRLERLTHDHSWVQSLVDDGKIDQDEAAVHPHRSLLLRVLNGQPANEPDLTRLPLQEGDRLLLCSDGLCGLVEDDEIAAGLAVPELERALEELVGAALAAGGIDNITVILADVLDGVPAVAGDTVEAVVLGAAAERGIPGTGGAQEDEDDDPEALRSGGATALGAASGPHGVGEPDEDEARYAPQPPRSRHRLRPLAGILVGVLVLAAAVGSAYAWGRTQYYVGVHQAQVAIYQGLPEKVVVPLSRVYEVQPLSVDGLPPFYADQVRAGIEVSSLRSARQTVAELSEAAQRCGLAAGGPTTGGRPSASPSPGAGASASPSPGAGASPRTTPSPRTTTATSRPGAGATRTSTPALGPTPRATSAPAAPSPSPTGGPGC